MTQRNGKQTPKKNGKHAANTRKDASPLNGIVPPEATRWKAGDPSPNPKGRPRKQHAVQELIKDLMGEIIDPKAPQMSRSMAAIRLRIMKDPMPFIEYAYGKVSTPVEITVYDSLAKNLGVTEEQARIIAERAARGEITISDVLTGRIEIDALPNDD